MGMIEKEEIARLKAENKLLSKQALSRIDELNEQISRLEVGIKSHKETIRNIRRENKLVINELQHERTKICKLLEEFQDWAVKDGVTVGSVRYHFPRMFAEYLKVK